MSNIILILKVIGFSHQLIISHHLQELQRYAGMVHTVLAVIEVAPVLIMVGLLDGYKIFH